MWKLYKQQEIFDGPVELTLIKEDDSFAQLKVEARRRAILDGCLPSNQHWVVSDDSKNCQLSVNNQYTFVLRDW